MLVMKTFDFGTGCNGVWDYFAGLPLCGLPGRGTAFNISRISGAYIASFVTGLMPSLLSRCRSVFIGTSNFSDISESVNPVIPILSAILPEIFVNVQGKLLLLNICIGKFGKKLINCNFFSTKYLTYCNL
jgi:hypothetical protein